MASDDLITGSAFFDQTIEPPRSSAHRNRGSALPRPHCVPSGDCREHRTGETTPAKLIDAESAGAARPRRSWGAVRPLGERGNRHAKRPERGDSSRSQSGGSRPARTRYSRCRRAPRASQITERRSRTSERSSKKCSRLPTASPLPPRRRHKPTTTRAHILLVRYCDNAASRSDPARGRRKLPPLPGDPRNARG